MPPLPEVRRWRITELSALMQDMDVAIVQERQALTTGSRNARRDAQRRTVLCALQLMRDRLLAACDQQLGGGPTATVLLHTASGLYRQGYAATAVAVGLLGE